MVEETAWASSRDSLPSVVLSEPRAMVFWSPCPLSQGKNVFRFVHASDIHLDSPLKGLELYDGAPAEEIRGATRRALINLVQLAIDEHAAFMIIAGDLYDGDWRDYNTGLFFVKEMSRLREANIPVVIAAGNHDAASRITRELRLPDGVTLLSARAPESVVLDELGVNICGQSFATAAVVDNLASSYPTGRRGYFNIAVLHTALDGREGHSAYAPCSPIELRTKGYDYWALGHVHLREIVSQDPYVVFPGNTQGRHARELGPKGASVVTVEDGLVSSVEPVELDVVRWETCEVDATETNCGEDVLELVSSRLAELAEGAGGRLLATRVFVRGRSPAHPDLAERPERWMNEIRALALDTAADVWIEKVKLATTTLLDIDKLASRDDPIGRLITGLRETSKDDSSINELTESLNDLVRRLPAQYWGLEDAVDFRNAEALKELLPSVEDFLLPRLLQGVAEE